MVRKIISISFMAAIVLTLFPGLGISAEPVTIGIVSEITGPAASSGGNYERGVLMAVEEINTAGGILGRKIETFTLDTKSEAPVSVAAMKRAIERNPFVVMGTVWSGSTIVNMSVLQQAGIPQFTGSEAPAITKKGNLNIFRTSHNSALGMEKLVNGLIGNLNVKKIAIFYSNTEFGKGLRDSIVPLLAAKGVNIRSKYLWMWDQMDFTGELMRAKASGADTFYFGAQEEECGRILPQIKAMGLDKLVKIMGSINLLAADTIRLAKEAADGAQGQVDFSPSGEKVKSLEAKYEKKYKEMAHS